MSTTVANCDECLELLPLYVGADLEQESASRVAAHLARCEACREAERCAARARAELVEAFRREAEQGSGRDLWVGVRAAILREREEALAARPRSGVEPSAESGAEGPAARQAHPERPVRPVRLGRTGRFGQGFPRRAAALLAAAAAVVLLMRVPLDPDDSGDASGLVQDRPGDPSDPNGLRELNGALEGAGTVVGATPVADVETAAPRGLVPIFRTADDRLIHQLPVDSPLHHVTTQRIYR